MLLSFQSDPSNYCLMKSFSQVDDLKEVVMKLAAADNLRSQGFLRSEQNLPKPNKRGQKWLELLFLMNTKVQSGCCSSGVLIHHGYVQNEKACL